MTSKDFVNLSGLDRSRPSVRELRDKWKSVEDQRLAKEVESSEWSQYKSMNLGRAHVAAEDAKNITKFVQLQEEETRQYHEHLAEIERRDAELVRLLLEEEEMKSRQEQQRLIHIDEELAKLAQDHEQRRQAETARTAAMDEDLARRHQQHEELAAVASRNRDSDADLARLLQEEEDKAEREAAQAKAELLKQIEDQDKKLRAKQAELAAERARLEANRLEHQARQRQVQQQQELEAAERRRKLEQQQYDEDDLYDDDGYDDPTPSAHTRTGAASRTSSSRGMSQWDVDDGSVYQSSILPPPAPVQSQGSRRQLGGASAVPPRANTFHPDPSPQPSDEPSDATLIEGIVFESEDEKRQYIKFQRAQIEAFKRFEAQKRDAEIARAYAQQLSLQEQRRRHQDQSDA